MKKKYFLVNKYIPCLCNCHKECLKRDLISRGIIIKSMENITEEEYYYYLGKYLEKHKSTCVEYVEF